MGNVTLGPFESGNKQAKEGAQYCIEGEYISMRDIAVRLGISNGAASTRMSLLKKQPGAITWDKLRAGGK